MDWKAVFRAQNLNMLYTLIRCQRRDDGCSAGARQTTANKAFTVIDVSRTMMSSLILVAKTAIVKLASNFAVLNYWMNERINCSRHASPHISGWGIVKASRQSSHRITWSSACERMWPYTRLLIRQCRLIIVVQTTLLGIITWLLTYWSADQCDQCPIVIRPTSTDHPSRDESRLMICPF